MHSSSFREARFSGCCPTPILGLLESQTPSNPPNPTANISTARYNFAVATASSLNQNTQFTNHEALPSLDESFYNFTKAYPKYNQTNQADQIREQEYYHLTHNNHVCLDYIGHGLFSHAQHQHQQQQSHSPKAAVASSSSSPHFPEPITFFDISYKSVNLISQILHGSQESELESKLRIRIMAFMNISPVDYTMVFTANQSSSLKLLADCYPFQSNQNLLTVYDYENEAVEMMTQSSKKKGARVMSAEFSWPNLRIQSGKLKKMIMSRGKKRNKGLFVFPLQSRMTGSCYSYQWMSMAQENGWHVLLDACALGPKDMDTLGLSLFKPDFLICSFYKVFGENPSGFGCLFVKKSSASVLKDSTNATNIGIVSLVPSSRTFQFPEEQAITDMEDDLDVRHSFSGPLSVQPRSGEIEEVSVKRRSLSFSQVIELATPFESARSKYSEGSVNWSSEIECRGLDHADSLGLILISSRARYLINWLVNALLSLQHPHTENGQPLPLVRMYGPKIMFDRGPAVAFNVFDWKGEKIDPTLVQKLADRKNISLSHGFLQNIWFSEEREKILETRRTEVNEGIVSKKRDKHQFQVPVVTAALGFLTNFQDTYRLWAFVSQFLDADFVEKERWRYIAIDQKTVEV